MSMFLAIVVALAILLAGGKFFSYLSDEYREIDAFYNSSIERWQARYLDSPFDTYVYGYTLQEAVDKCKARG